MAKKFLTIKEYSEKYGLPEAHVRGMTKQETPPFEIEWSGNKAYIVDEDDKEVSELQSQVEFLTKIVVTMCNHFGVNLDNFEKELVK